MPIFFDSETKSLPGKPQAIASGSFVYLPSHQLEVTKHNVGSFNTVSLFFNPFSEGETYTGATLPYNTVPTEWVRRSASFAEQSATVNSIITMYADEDITAPPVIEVGGYRYVRQDTLDTPRVTTMICHNASFDSKVLIEAFVRAGKPVPAMKWICTLKMLKAFPHVLDLPDNKLGTWFEKVFGEKLDNAHTAQVDTQALAVLFSDFLKRTRVLGIADEDVIAKSIYVPPVRYFSTTNTEEEGELPPGVHIVNADVPDIPTAVLKIDAPSAPDSSVPTEAPADAVPPHEAPATDAVPTAGAPDAGAPATEAPNPSDAPAVFVPPARPKVVVTLFFEEHTKSKSSSWNVIKTYQDKWATAYSHPTGNFTHRYFMECNADRIKMIEQNGKNQTITSLANSGLYDGVFYADDKTWRIFSPALLKTTTPPTAPTGG